MINLNKNGPFICDKCGSKSLHRSSFISHLQKHRKESSFFCDFCPRSFSLKNSLILHLKRCHLKLRPFDCELCGRKFSSRSDLKTHMLQHGRKTECKICHKFVTNIKKHMRCHIKTKCRICSKIYTQVGLNWHMKTHKNPHKQKLLNFITQ